MPTQCVVDEEGVAGDDARGEPSARVSQAVVAAVARRAAAAVEAQRAHAAMPLPREGRPPLLRDRVAGLEVKAGALQGQISMLEQQLAEERLRTRAALDRALVAEMELAFSLTQLENERARVAELEEENEQLRAQLAALEASAENNAVHEPPAQRPDEPSGLGQVELPVPEPTPSAPSDRPRHLRSEHEPYPWQRDALRLWEANDHRGVVQAVTGAGKTLVGAWAAAEALDEGRKVLVVVPTRELMNQWHRSLSSSLTAPVGRLGGGFRSDFGESPVIVGTVQTLSRRRPSLSNGGAGLLIADECHRYGAPKFADALDGRFSQRLGLTATYERDDNGNREYLDPYFGTIVKDLWYDEALAQKAISPFRIALVGVDFAPGEREVYDEVSGVLAKTAYALNDQYGVPAKPFGEFMRVVNLLAEHGDQAGRTARRYLGAFSKRRELLAETGCKLPALRSLAPVAAESRGSLVFTQTKESAQRAADIFAEAGCDAAAVYSGLDEQELSLRMGRFRSGNLGTLVAPRLLDEGIDVPDADLGIIVSASRSKRQMIQRLGRVIRRKEDRSGRLVVLYVKGTMEDPDLDTDSDFVTRCLPHAEAVGRFGSKDDGALLAFLRAGV